MVKLTIDGIQFEAAAGAMVLDVARAHNIYIPTLCNHESVLPYGACRLCIVEITTKSGRKRLVTSCLYPVEEGLTVLTNSEKVAAHRKMLMQLLMARCPESEIVKELGRSLVWRVHLSFGGPSQMYPLCVVHTCLHRSSRGIGDQLS